MSDYMIKIIPAVPGGQINTGKIQAVEHYLQSRVKADEICSITSRSPMFIDCGSNLENISCPFCGTLLDFDWWGESMDTAYTQNFQDLSVLLPCCGRKGSLHDLQYHFPCGFANTVFQILNPQQMPGAEDFTRIQKLLGEEIRVIHAHM